MYEQWGVRVDHKTGGQEVHSRRKTHSGWLGWPCCITNLLVLGQPLDAIWIRAFLGLPTSQRCSRRQVQAHASADVGRTSVRIKFVSTNEKQTHLCVAERAMFSNAVDRVERTLIAFSIALSKHRFIGKKGRPEGLFIVSVKEKRDGERGVFGWKKLYSVVDTRT